VAQDILKCPISPLAGMVLATLIYSLLVWRCNNGENRLLHFEQAPPCPPERQAATDTVGRLIREIHSWRYGVIILAGALSLLAILLQLVNLPKWK
jgi:hypothetical protein